MLPFLRRAATRAVPKKVGVKASTRVATKAPTKVATKVAWLVAKEAKTVAGAVEAKAAATGEVGKHVNEDILATGMTEFVGHQPLLCLFNASMYFLVVKRREILARNKL